MGLSEKNRRVLVQLARSSLEACVAGRIYEMDEDARKIDSVCGVFVTYHAKGVLRGCMGTIEGRQPLFEAVKRMAETAALRDPRFSPITPDEVLGIEIELSVLSPLKRMEAGDLVVGVHGVVLVCGQRQSVFLPQVASEQGWDKQTWLSQLARKAGLMSDAWREAELYGFTAEVFGER